MYKEEDGGSSDQHLFVQINKRWGTAPGAPRSARTLCRGGGGLGVPSPSPSPQGPRAKRPQSGLFGGIWARRAMD